MFGLIRKKKVIKLFAKELAEKQRKADWWFYIRHDNEMSSFCLQQADEIKTLVIKFNITNEVYNEAYKIYDFRNSGKANFTPDLSKLVI